MDVLLPHTWWYNANSSQCYEIGDEHLMKGDFPLFKILRLSTHSAGTRHNVLNATTGHFQSGK